MDVSEFSGSKPSPLHVFLFLNKSPGSSMNEQHTRWSCICNFPTFFPWALLWYVILGLFVRLMRTVHEYNCRHMHMHVYTHTVPDPQQAISLTSRANAVAKTGYETVSWASQPDKSKVKKFLVTQQNQMPMAWNVKATLSVFVPLFMFDAYAWLITDCYGCCWTFFII